jgi:hypothetical protein
VKESRFKREDESINGMRKVYMKKQFLNNILDENTKRKGV